MNDPSPRVLEFFAKKIPELAGKARGGSGLEKVQWVSLGDGPSRENGTGKQSPLAMPFAAISIDDASQQGNSAWWDVAVLVEIHNELRREQIDPDANLPPPVDGMTDTYQLRKQNLWLGAAVLFEIGQWAATFEKGIVLPTGVSINGIGQATNRQSPEVKDATVYVQAPRFVVTCALAVA